MSGHFLAVSSLVLAALFCGGSAEFIEWLDIVPLVLAVPVLLWSLARLDHRADAWAHGLLFTVGLALVPIVQLIPLPPAVWASLPFRELLLTPLTASGADTGWRPVSLTPVQTSLAFLSLLPPLALFYATLNLTLIERRRLIMIMVGGGVAASLLGLVQVALGQPGWLVALGFRDHSEASATLANRNIFAALLYSLLVFASCFVIDRVNALPARASRFRSSRLLVVAFAAFVVMVILMSGLIMARSRAGIILTILALIGIAAMAGGYRRVRGAGARRVIAVAAGIVLFFASQYGLWRLLDRFEADPLADARVAYARNTWDAAMAFMPWGSGLGSFTPVYQMLEPIQDAIPDRYAGRAHNDFLEVWLETGVLGLALMALFAAWLARSLWQVWRPKREAAFLGEPLDQLIVRAASLVILLLLAHSFVDFPLRTIALAAVFAVSCGVLFPARALGAQGAPDLRSRLHDRADVTAAPQARGGRRRRPPYAKACIDQEAVTACTAPVPDRGEAPPAVLDNVQAWPWPVSPSKPDTTSPPSRSAGAADRATVPLTDPSQPSPAALKPGQRWGTNDMWPEAWTKAKPERSSNDDKP